MKRRSDTCRWEQCERQGDLAYDDHRYADAQKFYLEAIAISTNNAELAHQKIESVHKLAKTLFELGQLTEAEPLFEEALRSKEKLCGALHPDLLQLLDDLAMAYSTRHFTSGATELYKRTFAIAEQAFGPCDIDTIQSMWRLVLRPHGNTSDSAHDAMLADLIGRLDVATKALEETPLPDLQTATKLSQVADIYNWAAMEAKAEAIRERASSLAEKLLSLDHEDAPKYLTSSAIECYVMGDLDHAEELLKKALNMIEERHGPNHCSSVPVLRNLADVFQRGGLADKAETTLRKAIEIQEAASGSNYSELVDSLTALAHVYGQNKGPEAEDQMYLKALKVLEDTLGTDSEKVADLLVKMGDKLATSNDPCMLERAENYYKRALSIQERIFGSTHAKVVAPLQGLATIFRLRGKMEWAVPLLKNALAASEKSSGLESTATLSSAWLLGTVYLEQKDYVAAESTLKRIVATSDRLKAAGESFPWVAAPTFMSLGRLYLQSQNFVSAEDMFRRVVPEPEPDEIDRPWHIESILSLAVACHRQQKYLQSETFYKRVIAAVSTSFSPDTSGLMTVLGLYADLLRETDRHPEACQVMQEINELSPKKPDLSNRST